MTVPAPETVCFLSIGALGTGFLEASLRRGLEGPVDFIGADAGSTDGGPGALAEGRWTARERALRHELGILLPAAKQHGVPLLIGSCGLSGSDVNVDYMAELVDVDVLPVPFELPGFDFAVAFSAASKDDPAHAWFRALTVAACKAGFGQRVSRTAR